MSILVRFLEHLSVCLCAVIRPGPELDPVRLPTLTVQADSNSHSFSSHGLEYGPLTPLDPPLILADRTTTQYDRLLASS